MSTASPLASYPDPTQGLAPEELLRILHSGVGATMSVFGNDLRFRYVNAEFAKAFGLMPQDMVGMPLSTVYGDMHLDAFMPHVLRALAGESVTYERFGRMQLSDGIWRTISLRPWLDAEGAVIGVVSASLQVHELKVSTEALRVAHEQLRETALRDALTGLLNRRALIERLNTSLMRAQRTQEPIAVLFIDLDGFKHVNDDFGHAAGDEVLRDVAERLLQAVRETDVVARLGGDEFVVLLEVEVDAGTPALVCQRILAALQLPCVFSNGQAMVGASIGVARHPPNPATDLLKLADAAMYDAKHAGKGRVCYAA